VSRILGIDLGTKRIGLAIAEPGALRARPLATLGRGRSVGADATALRTVAGANGVGELVVGLPLDMSGGEGRAAEAARAWAVAIAEATGLPVALRDERLSSHVAEGRVGPAKRGPSGGPPGPARRAANRARIDREAARVILEDELTARALGSPGEWIMPRTRPAPAAEAAQAGSGTLVPSAQEGGDGTAGASTIPVPGPGSHEDGA
jgi:putative transcription antitermination factor YqgF